MQVQLPQNFKIDFVASHHSWGSTFWWSRSFQEIVWTRGGMFLKVQFHLTTSLHCCRYVYLSKHANLLAPARPGPEVLP